MARVPREQDLDGQAVAGAYTVAPDLQLPRTRVELPARRFERQTEGDARATAGRLARIAFGISEGFAPEAAKRRDSALRRLLGLADVLAAAIALVAAVPLIGSDGLRPAAVAVPLIVVTASRLMRLHDHDELVLAKTTMTEAPRLFQLATLCALVTYIGESQFIHGRLGALQGTALWAAFALSSLVCRAVVRRLGVHYSPPERCLVIGDRESVAEVRSKVRDGWNMKVEIVAEIAPSHLPAGQEGRRALARMVREAGVHRVVVAFSDLGTERLLELVRDMKALGIKVTIKPRLLDVVGSAVVFDDVHGSVFLGVRRFGLTSSERRIKRLIDVVGALVLLVVLSPALAVIAVMIKCDSRGPVLFRQVRVGRNGRRFQILKFRTMVADAEELKAALLHRNEAAGIFKLAEDPRVTRVGRALRRTALDELPQLLNVLKGDMSLVGPRPLVIDEDERVGGWHRRRLDLEPGMTGVWQVLGSARISLREMVALDYLYIVNWSVWNDVQILLRTVPFVLSRRGM